MFFCEFHEIFKNTNFVKNLQGATSVTRLGRKSFLKSVYEWTNDFLNKNIENIRIIRSIIVQKIWCLYKQILKHNCFHKNDARILKLFLTVTTRKSFVFVSRFMILFLGKWEKLHHEKWKLQSIFQIMIATLIRTLRNKIFKKATSRQKQKKMNITNKFFVFELV